MTDQPSKPDLLTPSPFDRLTCFYASADRGSNTNMTAQAPKPAGTDHPKAQQPGLSEWAKKMLEKQHKQTQPSERSP